MKENKSRDGKTRRNSKACPWVSDPAFLGGTNPNHAPKANGFRPQSCAGDQPSWRHPQCVGRRPRLAGARRWPGPTACGGQVWPWRGRRGGAFLPACLQGPSWCSLQDAVSPVASSHAGSPKWESRKEAHYVAENPASLALFFFFYPGVVAVALSFVRTAGWHRPLLCPPGPSPVASS